MNATPTPRFQRDPINPGQIRELVTESMSGRWGDHPMTYTCWSEREAARIGQNPGLVVHLHGGTYGGQAEHTLCGIEMDGYWGAEAHSYPPDEFRGCVRCQRAWWRRYGGAAAEQIPLREEVYPLRVVEEHQLGGQRVYEVYFNFQNKLVFASFAHDAPELPADFATAWRRYEIVKVFRELVFLRYRFQHQGGPAA